MGAAPVQPGDHANPYYAEHFEALAASCADRRVAVQTIKSIARAPWLGRPHTRSTWYEPFEHQEDIDVLVWWVLGRRGLFLNSVGDLDLLPRVLDAATRFAARPDGAAIGSLLTRARAEPLFV